MRISPTIHENKMDDANKAKRLARAKIQPEGRRRSHHAVRPQLQTIATLDGRTNAAKLFKKLIANIETDLGGHDELSEIEVQLVEAYAGSSVLLANLNAKIALGEDISAGEHALIASTMVRLAGKLGLRRRPRDVTPNLDDLLREEANNG
jgi:hypothetical protein